MRGDLTAPTPDPTTRVLERAMADAARVLSTLADELPAESDVALDLEERAERWTLCARLRGERAT